MLDIDYLCSNEGVGGLTQVLKYHVVSEVLPSIYIPAGKSKVQSVQGGFVTLNYLYPNTMDEILYVNSAIVIGINVGSINGLIHEIDEVLEIPRVPSAGR
jgi:uncharacterized surface protein with fasciclin (FAS1) repeats